MKKRWLLVGLMISMLGLTGCTSAVPLTDDQENMIAEYMAKEILDSQEGYTQALIEPTPTPTPTPTAEPTVTQPPKALDTPTSGPSDQTSPGSDLASNQQANADFAQVIGMTNIKVEYTGYETVKELTEGSFHLEPSKGKELFLIQFDVTNTSKKEISFNLGSLDISYLLDLNTKLKVHPLVTLKDNDLRFIDLVIKAGETKHTLILFELDQKVKIKQANLIISREDKTAIIELK